VKAFRVLIFEAALIFFMFKPHVVPATTYGPHAVAPLPQAEVSWKSPLPIPQSIMRLGAPMRGQPFNRRYDYKPRTSAIFQGRYLISTDHAWFEFAPGAIYNYGNFGMLNFQLLVRARDPRKEFARLKLLRPSPHQGKYAKVLVMPIVYDLHFGF